MIKSKKHMTVVAAALAMCMAGSAFAQDGRFDRGPTRHGPELQHRGPAGHGRPDFHPRPQAVRHGYVHPHAQWHRGDRLPTQYRGHGYVVNDWHARRLQAPPRGYQWVGVGGDFVLAAIATGLIAQIIAGS